MTSFNNFLINGKSFFTNNNKNYKNFSRFDTFVISPKNFYYPLDINWSIVL